MQLDRQEKLRGFKGGISSVARYVGGKQAARKIEEWSGTKEEGVGVAIGEERARSCRSLSSGKAEARVRSRDRKRT